MSPLIKIENLSKSFGGVRALSSVHFEVLPGEVHALVGENGAGKSTLIKILMGVYHKDTGSIVIDGNEQEIRSLQSQGTRVSRSLSGRHVGASFERVRKLLYGFASAERRTG